MFCLFAFALAYLCLFITQWAVAEAQKSLKNALITTHLIAVTVAYPVFKHMQDPLTFHFMLSRKKRKKVQLNKPVCNSWEK